jgi:hypothetical protein
MKSRWWLFSSLLLVGLFPRGDPLAQEAVVIVGRLADGTPPVSVAAEEPPAVDILETTVRQLPDRKLIIHRVSEASLPPKLIGNATPAGSDTSQSLAEALEPTPPPTVLCIHATVIDRQTTLLTWTHEGNPYMAWSNVDFNYLTGFTQFRKGDRRYVNPMFVENLDSSQAADPAAYAPPEELHIEDPAFLPMEGDFDNAEAIEPVLALHELYLNEEARLKQAFEGRKAERTIDPPQAEDIVLHYWKVQSKDAKLAKPEGGGG